MRYSFTGNLWKYPGEAAWYFLTLPIEYTEELKSFRNEHYRNFGSVKIKATIGPISWNTSIFPDNKTGSFLLPVKKDVRIKNSLSEGQFVDCEIEVLLRAL